MPSGRARKRPEPQPPIFFFDRGVGRHLVPEVFRTAGYEVRIMVEVYPDGNDQNVTDPEWIARASSEGWVAITKDISILRHHEDALLASTLVVFALPNANLTGDQMAARFNTHLNRIAQRSRHPGPVVWVVKADGLERRWPRPPTT